MTSFLRLFFSTYMMVFIFDFMCLVTSILSATPNFDIALQSSEAFLVLQKLMVRFMALSYRKNHLFFPISNQILSPFFSPPIKNKLIKNKLLNIDLYPNLVYALLDGIPKSPNFETQAPQSQPALATAVKNSSSARPTLDAKFRAPPSGQDSFIVSKNVSHIPNLANISPLPGYSSFEVGREGGGHTTLINMFQFFLAYFIVKKRPFASDEDDDVEEIFAYAYPPTAATSPVRTSTKVANHTPVSAAFNNQVGNDYRGTETQEVSHAMMDVDLHSAAPYIHPEHTQILVGYTHDDSSIPPSVNHSKKPVAYLVRIFPSLSFSLSLFFFFFFFWNLMYVPSRGYEHCAESNRDAFHLCCFDSIATTSISTSFYTSSRIISNITDPCQDSIKSFLRTHHQFWSSNQNQQRSESRI